MSVKPPEDCASLEDVRRGIDALDLDIIRLIGERSQYVKAAAKFKTRGCYELTQKRLTNAGN